MKKDFKLYMPFLSHYRVTSDYGWRFIFGKREFHNGRDFGGMKKGEKIRSAEKGIIAVQRESSGYGKFIIIDHEHLGISTLYAHLDKFHYFLKVGSQVVANEHIGFLGATGDRVTGPHLHFEVRNTLYGPGYFEKHETGQFKNSEHPAFYLPSEFAQGQIVKALINGRINDINHKPDDHFTKAETLAIFERIAESITEKIVDELTMSKTPGLQADEVEGPDKQEN